LLEDEAVRRHAIDVSSLLEVGVCEFSPMPFSTETHGQIVGLVCEHGAGTRHFCVQASTSGRARGLVWLNDPAKGNLEMNNAGELRRQLTVIGLINTMEIQPRIEP
jgi:hypothetical protein